MRLGVVGTSVAVGVWWLHYSEECDGGYLWQMVVWKTGQHDILPQNQGPVSVEEARREGATQPVLYQKGEAVIKVVLFQKGEAVFQVDLYQEGEAVIELVLYCNGEAVIEPVLYWNGEAVFQLISTISWDWDCLWTSLYH